MAKKYLIVGETGVGKTWVMVELIKHFDLDRTGKFGLVNYHHNGSVIVTGKYDGSTFQGSDKLSMAVMSDVEAFVYTNKDKTIFFEGDRFTNRNFIAQVNPVILKILGDGSEGRNKRGSNQSDRQIKSIKTRVSKVEATIVFNNSDECLKYIIANE